MPVRRSVPGARAPVDRAAELPQLAFRLVAVAQRAARLEVPGRALELADGAVALAGLGEGAAGEHPRQRRLDRRSDLVGGRGRRERPLGCAAGSPASRSTAAAARSAQAAAIGSCTAAAQPPRSRRRASGLGLCVEREPAAREHLEVPALSGSRR